VEPDAVERYLSGGYQRVHGVRPRSAVAPVGTYLIRWQQLSVTDSLVDGSRMMRVDPGGERLSRPTRPNCDVGPATLICSRECAFLTGTDILKAP
jgi:hypothetical protein